MKLTKGQIFELKNPKYSNFEFDVILTPIGKIMDRDNIKKDHVILNNVLYLNMPWRPHRFVYTNRVYVLLDPNIRNLKLRYKEKWDNDYYFTLLNVDNYIEIALVSPLSHFWKGSAYKINDITDMAKIKEGGDIRILEKELKINSPSNVSNNLEPYPLFQSGQDGLDVDILINGF